MTVRNVQVNHSEEAYAHYDYRSKEIASVNSVENFWKQFKASVCGTHVHITRKHMPEYLGEFTYPCEPPRDGKREV